MYKVKEGGRQRREVDKAVVILTSLPYNLDLIQTAGIGTREQRFAAYAAKFSVDRPCDVLEHIQMSIVV